MPCPRIDYDFTTLSIGSTINIWGRRLKIVGFADSTTKNNVGVDRSTLFVKDAFEAGEVMAAAQEEGLHLRALKSTSAGTGMTFVGKDALERLQRATTGMGVVVATSIDQANTMAKELETLSLHSSCAPDSTLLLIKPHAVAKGVTPNIMEALAGAGLVINAIWKVHLNVEQSETFFAVYKGILKEYSQCITELASMPCIVMDVGNANGTAHAVLRQLCGPYDVEIARLVAC